MKAIAEGMRCIQPPSGTRKKVDDDDDEWFPLLQQSENYCGYKIVFHLKHEESVMTTESFLKFCNAICSLVNFFAH